MIYMEAEFDVLFHSTWRDCRIAIHMKENNIVSL